MTNLESVAVLVGCAVTGVRLGWWARGRWQGLDETRPRVASHIRALEPPEVIELSGARAGWARRESERAE